MRLWGGLVLVATAACAPGVRVVAPVVPRAAAAPPPPACATMTEREEQRAALAATAKEVYADARQAIDAARWFAPDIHDENEAKREAAEAAADRTREEETAALEAQQARLELPVRVGATRIAEGDARNGPAWSFDGCEPTDAGGIEDGNCWSHVVVRVGCAWTRLEIGGNALGVATQTTPTGERIFTTSSVSGQCGRSAEYFVVREGKAVRVASFGMSRMEDICGGHVLENEHVGGEVLTAIRTLAHEPENDTSRLVSDLVWNGFVYEERVTPGASAAAPPRSP